MNETMCSRCGVNHPADANPCPACGFDRYVELEIDAFLTPAIERARKWILAIGILYIVGAVIDYIDVRQQLEELAARGFGDIPVPDAVWWVIGTQLALGAFHFGIWVWAKKMPFAASLVALASFVVLNIVIAAAFNPAEMFSLLRVIFLIVLLMAVSAAYKARQMRAQRATPQSLPTASLR